MTIPFGLSPDIVASRYRGLLERHSQALIHQLRSVIATPIGNEVTSASFEIFVDESGEFGPSIGMYFDGPNKRVDRTDQSIFPGRHLPIAEFLKGIDKAFDPQYFSDLDSGILDIQASQVIQWFAEWWWKAGGWDYPLAVTIQVHDEYGDIDGIDLSPGR